MSENDPTPENYCLFCGEPVAPEGVRRGFLEQFGEIECEGCETRYRVEVSIL